MCVCACVRACVLTHAIFFFALELSRRGNVDEEDPNGSEFSSLLHDQNDVETYNWKEGVQSFMILSRNNFQFKSQIRRKTLSYQ